MGHLEDVEDCSNASSLRSVCLGKTRRASSAAKTRPSCGATIAHISALRWVLCCAERVMMKHIRTSILIVASAGKLGISHPSRRTSEWWRCMTKEAAQVWISVRDLGFFAGSVHASGLLGWYILGPEWSGCCWASPRMASLSVVGATGWQVSASFIFL